MSSPRLRAAVLAGGSSLKAAPESPRHRERARRGQSFGLTAAPGSAPNPSQHAVQYVDQPAVGILDIAGHCARACLPSALALDRAAVGTGRVH
jgi:hypothetical protein